MEIDGALQFSGTPGVAGSPDVPTTGTQQSTNIVDLVNARDMGIGDNPALKLLCTIKTAFAGGTSLQVQFQGAPDNAGSPGTWTTYAESGAIVLADLAVGRYLLPMDIPRPPPGIALPRFYRLQYVSAGTFTGGGGIFAAIVLDRADYVNYPAGITVPN